MAVIDDYTILEVLDSAERVAIYMKDNSWGYSSGVKTPANLNLVVMAANNLTFRGIKTEVPEASDVDNAYEFASERIEEMIKAVEEFITFRHLEGLIR